MSNAIKNDGLLGQFVLSGWILIGAQDGEPKVLRIREHMAECPIFTSVEAAQKAQKIADAYGVQFSIRKVRAQFTIVPDDGATTAPAIDPAPANDEPEKAVEPVRTA